MSHWWRAHDDSVDNPKLCLLSDRAHRGWYNLMCLASANGGALPAMDVLRVKLRLPAKKIEAILSELKERELLDEVDGVFHPHNWNERQFKSDVSTERVKRFRKRSGNVSETPPDSREQNTEKKDAPNGASDPERDLFRRGKELFGENAGGLIAKLLKSKKNNVPLARAAIEQASTKQDPREYVGAVINGGHASEDGRRLTNDEQYWGKGRTPGII